MRRRHREDDEVAVKGRSAAAGQHSPLHHALTGPATDKKRREIERGVSPEVKRAVERSIRDNKQALRELEKE
jgi:hypothetical protein